MQIRKHFMMLLMLFVTERMKAQISAPPVDLIQVRTTAPEAASLGRFGNIPSVIVPECQGSAFPLRLLM